MSALPVFTLPMLLCGGLGLVGTVSMAQAQTVCADGNENPAIVASTPSSFFEFDKLDKVPDGMAIQRPTNLAWMRCALGQSWDGQTCTGSADLLTWQQALQAAEQFEFGGFSDWRLPDRNELDSIVEQRCWSPSINVEVFPDTPPLGFVTSSPFAINNMRGAPAQVWFVAFDDGDLIAEDSDALFHVRLVRGGTYQR